jgi:RNA-directed DNA polymerase
MITDSPHRYIRLGLSDGRSRDLLNTAVAEAQQVEVSGLTSVLTLNHLAWQTGASYLYLRSIVQRQIDPYDDILRYRRNGAAMRLISAPNPPLMSVQRWILRNIIQRVNVHSASAAYSPGNSISLCAKRHLGANWLVKMDLRDFFHSIDERRIYSVFQGLGYNRLISFELARICTRAGLGPILAPTSVPHYTINSYRTWKLGALPQGSPTSGALANIVMYTCDEALSEIAAVQGLVYTRYADDITFSHADRFDRRRAEELIRVTSEALRSHGFTLHSRKTKIVPPGSRKIVLGLLVDGNSVRLSKNVRCQIDTHIRGADVFGLKEHALHRGFSSVFGFVHHIDGLLAFARDVDPEYADARYRSWNEVKRRQGFPFSYKPDRRARHPA